MLSFKFLKYPTSNQLDQLIACYEEAGWWGAANDNLDLVKGIIAGSHCFCAATIDDRIIGMGRAISDGVSDAYIQDVTVLKDFRQRGIGTKLVAKLIEKLEADGIGWIGLIAESGAARFYRPLNFAPMPNATPMLRLKR